MSKTTNYLKSAIAFITGDDATATALHIARNADASWKAAIASEDCKLLDAQNELADAQEKLEGARVNNGSKITDRQTFLNNVVYAANRVKQAEVKITAIEETIAMFKAEQENVNL